MKLIKDHPDTWSYIIKQNQNRLVTNPEKINKQMIFANTTEFKGKDKGDKFSDKSPGSQHGSMSPTGRNLS